MKLVYQNYVEKGSFKVNEKSKPIFLPKLTWIEMINISCDEIILVLSSDEYNISESLRDKNQFISYIQK